MAMERTLSILKPNAVRKNQVGAVVAMLEKGGLRVRAMRMLRLSRVEAEAFYAVHRERPFFASLCAFMTSGPVVAIALEGEGAVAQNRAIMGATDPKKAAHATIRALYGEDVEKNAVHGSDAVETARAEIAFFFSELDLPPVE